MLGQTALIQGAGIIENYDIVFQESQTLRSIVLITGFIIKKKRYLCFYMGRHKFSYFNRCIPFYFEEHHVTMCIF